MARLAAAFAWLVVWLGLLAVLTATFYLTISAAAGFWRWATGRE
jgi:hypothetical protein